MPKAVYVLALGIFAMVTSEFVVAGLMPQISEGLGATIPEVGYLITAFAVAMAIGGPFLATAVLKLPHKSALMALFADLTAPALIFMMGIGLVGVTMNPCMITRVQRTANARPLVNTVHSSFITLGIVIGSWLGGVGINAYGLRAPLVLGVIMAFLGLFTLLPDLRAGRTAAAPAAPERQPAAV